MVPCGELTHLKRPWSWERLKVGGERDDRGWDGWMASLTQWTWVWVNSGSWWWTGKPGVLQSMDHKESDMTERLNWNELRTSGKQHPKYLSLLLWRHLGRRKERVAGVTPSKASDLRVRFMYDTLFFCKSTRNIKIFLLSLLSLKLL